MNESCFKLFIYGLLRLRSLNEKITFDEVEGNLSKGIATYFTEKYENMFRTIGYQFEMNKKIDGVCKTYANFFGEEERKFGIANDDGIMFLLALFINYENLKVSFDDFI